MTVKYAFFNLKENTFLLNIETVIIETMKDTYCFDYEWLNTKEDVATKIIKIHQIVFSQCVNEINI